MSRRPWTEDLRRRLVERALLFFAEDGAGRAPGPNRGLRASLRNALKGLVFSFLMSRNFRIECACLALALVLGAVLRLGRLEWALVLQASLLVLALEAKNTSIEQSVDLSTESYHYGAKGSKDAASAGVLIAAAAALLTGLLVFGPRLLAALGAAAGGGRGTP